jgi:hypothetical protein
MFDSDRSTNPFHILLGLVIVVAVAGFFFLSTPPRPPSQDPRIMEARQLVVEHSQGGVAEQVTVRSFGRDGVDRTHDDVVSTRHAVNLRGSARA